jgi:CspA family cold shock protein
MMLMGEIRWFNPERGFGFIKSKKGPDIFVHFTAIQTDGYRTLSEGQHVCYNVVRGKNGLMATNVVPLTYVRATSPLRNILPKS